MPFPSTIHLKEGHRSWCNSASTKSIRRVGRLQCNLANTGKLEENWKTREQLGQPEDRVQSATRIPEPGPQGKTEHWNWFTRKDRNLRVGHREGLRTENIWN